MKKIGKKKLIISSVVIIALLLLGILILYLMPQNEEAKDKDITYEAYTIHKGTEGKVEKYDPSMTVDGLEPGEYAYYITGKISSKEDKEFSIITFNLYDEENNLLGTAIAGLNNLEKNRIYDFKAISMVKPDEVEKIKRYELKSVELGN